MSSSFDNVEAGGDLGRLAQHDAGRAVLVVAHGDRTFHRAGGHTFARDGEVHVDLGEHLGVHLGAFAGQFDAAAAHVVATPLENQHHVVGRAAAGARQQGFHRARR